MKLHFYPYTYVRTIVMKTKLLQREDYNTMLKMGTQEIINYLQSKGYHEFASAANTYEGISLVEHAVKEHLVSAFSKLRRVSNEDLRVVIDMYLMRYDLLNLKTVLRGILFKQDVKNLLIPAGMHDKAFYEEMLGKDFDGALAMLRGTVFAELRTYENKDSLFHLETKCDQLYYEHLFAFVRALGNQSVLFRQFILEEIMTRNIMTVLKLLKDKQNVDFSTVLLPFGEDKFLTRLSSCTTLADAIVLLEKSRYAKHITQGISTLREKGSLIDLEKDLRTFLLRRLKRQSHQNLLSVDVILDFLFEMDLEIKNILLIFKARTFGLDEQFVKENLIV